MRDRLRATLLLSLVVVVVSDARADERIIVRGVSVGTFGSSDMTPLFGIGLGANLGSVLQLTFEASREFGRADPRRAPVPVATATRIPTEFVVVFIPIESIRVDRRLAGGARFRFPSRRRLKPFVGINAGLARVTDRYEPGSFRDEGSTDIRPLIEGEGGIAISLTKHVAIETSYHYGQMLHAFDNDVVHGFGVSAALGF